MNSGDNNTAAQFSYWRRPLCKLIDFVSTLSDAWRRYNIILPISFFALFKLFPLFLLIFFYFTPFQNDNKRNPLITFPFTFFFNLFFFLMNKYIYMYRFYWQTAPLKCGIDCFWYLPSFSVTIRPSWISPVNGNQFGSITEIIHTIDKSCHNLLYVKKKNHIIVNFSSLKLW